MAFSGEEDPIDELISHALWDETNHQLERCRQAELKPAVPRPIQHRWTVIRDHIEAAQRLFNDYFAKEPQWGLAVFLRYFRMQLNLFVYIVSVLSARYMYFKQRSDDSGRHRLSPLQKRTSAIRWLTNGGPTDMFDEYLRIGDTTGREGLKCFCKGIIETFSPTYL